MAAPDDLSIIPRPAEIERAAGAFLLSPETVIVADEVNRRNAAYLHDLLTPSTGYPLPICADAPQGGSVIRLGTGGPDKLGREGYTLSVSPQAITVRAPQAAGILYGIQTLRQLLPAEIERRTLVPGATWSVPCVVVHDAPRFEWRGFMLDEGRHFHGKETVLRLLDLMALHKLNVLHWHLTEDQGWRIEIARYPRLTEVGSTRAGTARTWFGQHNGIPHGGFYTQAEIRDIVAYAAARQIAVVPEIEIPGHSMAALAAYPELGCTGGPFEVSYRFGPTWDIYCAGKEATFEFLQNVLDEVMGLFPSPYIHLGGDEAPKARWKKCPHCQRRIAQEGLAGEHALQVYMINRMVDYVGARDRRVVGWNQILGEGLAESAVPQYWIGNRKAVVEAIRGGREAIVSSWRYAYLDHSYALTPLSAAYAFDPIFPELDARDAGHVLGLEALLWTEFVPNAARLDYQTFPRLTALAETGWSPRKTKDFADFGRRLSSFTSRFDVLGVRYARGKDVAPSWLRRLLGWFTVLQPQDQVAG